MLKRAFDISASFVGLVIASPLLVPTCLLVWLQDYHSPFYVAPRVGRNGRLFRMVKLRSMVMNADKSGVASTSANDRRITRVGHFIRKFKLDELTQLWNVFIGDMSLVGPRPNVEVETSLYTSEEARMLSVKPGITDFASIVFADEGDILKGATHPDLLYNQIIRPWKSRLALLYIDQQNFVLDLKLILLTLVAILSRNRALQAIHHLLVSYGASPDLIEISKRASPLRPAAPPGAEQIVMNR